jgi:hypothetical protein
VRSPRSTADVPTTTPAAHALAKELKSQGYRFRGPTSVYAFMQNTRMVNDHDPVLGDVGGLDVPGEAGVRRPHNLLSQQAFSGR